jgi:hypothetical protein
MQVVAVTHPLSLGLRRMAMIGVRSAGPTDDIAKTLQNMTDIDYLVVTADSLDFMRGRGRRRRRFVSPTASDRSPAPRPRPSSTST